MIYIHPKTRQRVSFQANSGDTEFDLIGDKAISEETVPVIGPWSDRTGSDSSGKVNSRTLQITPVPNIFQGTDPGLEGEKLTNLNKVGQPSTYTRRRTKRETI